jgi:hypothetical protein
LPEPIILGLIAAGSAIVGGVITAIARPWGQDCVNRKAEERAEVRRRDKAAEERQDAETAETHRRGELAEERERTALAKASEERMAAIRATRERLSEAMAQYELEWQGHARSNEGKAAAILAASQTWMASRDIASDTVKEAVDRWKELFDDMDSATPPAGSQPPTRS